MPDGRVQTDSRIAVTVVTGYLGAGKTTLVNRLLADTQGRRYAVIVNEFGEIGIDGDLIESGDEELIELNSGCICCVVRGDLIRTLRDLLQRRPELDGILIETTGLANPGPVIQTFFADQILQAQCRLDSVVVLVDALHIQEQLASHGDAADQIALADRIILNKSSEATARLPEIESALRALNPFAPILRTDRSRIDPAELMNSQSFALDKIEPNLAALPQDHHIHHHHAQDHIAEGSITSVSVSTSRPVDAEKLEAWLQDMLAVHGKDVLRTKGICNVQREPRKLVVQAVHMMLEGDFTQPWAATETRETRLVFIGRNLDATALHDGLLSATSSPAQ